MAQSTPVGVTPATSTSNLSHSTSEKDETEVVAPRTPKGLSFWLAFMAVLLSLFLSVLDLCAVPTALPTIVAELQGGDRFVWVGSGYALASTAVLLLCGRLADVFGRRPVMLSCIALFAAGSALAGAAQNMNMMIAARVVQGMGGGCIYTMSQIITSDLVPLAERPTYQSALVMVYAFAAGVGPVVGGLLSEKASWRWLFYINLPLTGMAFAAVAIFLRVNMPQGAIMGKLASMDWLGNGLIAAGSTLTLIGLTWGGVHYPWASVHVLAPLAIGVVLIGTFIAYEYFLCRKESQQANIASSDKLMHPATLPLDILSHRTSTFGYLATFIHGITSISSIYYMPVFFQACMGASPIRSSVDTLPIALVMAPFAIFCGITIKTTRAYRPVNLIGWSFAIVGFGLMTLLRPDSSTAQWAGFQFLMSAGNGMVYASTIFPILAPLPVARNAAALAFFAFCCTFAQSWGIAVSGVILQNQLKSKLPDTFASLFPEGVEIAVAAVPIIRTLDDSLKLEVEVAFAESLAVVWKIMLGLSGLGFLTVFLLKELPMSSHTDEKYGLASSNVLTDPEVGSSEQAP
ncbi:MFS general substrate transporter [Daedaleopsis nitida]|nr:MFS general substrate transporter [Daedaleopsis nitida]